MSIFLPSWFLIVLPCYIVVFQEIPVIFLEIPFVSLGFSTSFLQNLMASLFMVNFPDSVESL